MYILLRSTKLHGASFKSPSSLRPSAKSIESSYPFESRLLFSPGFIRILPPKFGLLGLDKPSPVEDPKPSMFLPSTPFWLGMGWADPKSEFDLDPSGLTIGHSVLFVAAEGHPLQFLISDSPIFSFCLPS